MAAEPPVRASSPPQTQPPRQSRNVPKLEETELDGPIHPQERIPEPPARTPSPPWRSPTPSLPASFPESDLFELLPCSSLSSVSSSTQCGPSSAEDTDSAGVKAPQAPVDISHPPGPSGSADDFAASEHVDAAVDSVAQVAPLAAYRLHCFVLFQGVPNCIIFFKIEACLFLVV